MPKATRLRLLKEAASVNSLQALLPGPANEAPEESKNEPEPDDDSDEVIDVVDPDEEEEPEEEPQQSSQPETRKPKPEPKPITALTGRARDVFEAKTVMKTWADAVGRWMSGRPAGIDEYREKFPGLAGDKVINTAKAFWEALEAWNRGLK
jgi:hypothetical protein